jgi:hypothetical protein
MRLAKRTISMPDDTRSHTWFGGLFHPIQHASHGLYRPAVGAWISDDGDLLGMIAAPPGHAARALEQALQAALRRSRLHSPTRLAVQDDRLRERLRRHTDLPIDPQAHPRFASIVGAALARIALRDSVLPHAEPPVSHALARALFLRAHPAALPASVPLHAR